MLAFLIKYESLKMRSYVLNKKRKMKPKNLPMSFADYEVLAYPFGWKAEYWDGQARLTPREMGVTTRLNLPLSPIQKTTLRHHTLVPVDSTYAEQMIAGYFEVFADSVEFCNWPVENIQESAESDIRRYFEGKRGNPLPASVIALEPNTQKLAGLALFALKAEQRPRLELLYVRSPFQRQGNSVRTLADSAQALADSAQALVDSAQALVDSA